MYVRNIFTALSGKLFKISGRRMNRAMTEVTSVQLKHKQRTLHALRHFELLFSKVQHAVWSNRKHIHYFH